MTTGSGVKERVVENVSALRVAWPVRGLLQAGFALIWALSAAAVAGERDDRLDGAQNDNEDQYEEPYSERDPFEAWNRPVHNFNESLDVRVLQPVARGYRAITPRPVERGVANFFDNLSLPLSAVGGLLQLDSERMLKESGRFVLNSTIGVAGLFDPATALGFERQNEDIGQALESWGATDSPYLVLPLMGPMTLVQIPDRVASPFVAPALLGSYWRDYYRAIDLISTRADLLSTTALLDESTGDSYIFTREAYLQRRRFLLYDGEPPPEDFDALFEEF